MRIARHRVNKRPDAVKVLDQYDVAADAKKRVSLRNSKTKYFHVQALSNGCYLLEPRVLVPPQAVPRRTLKMLEQSVTNLKKGLASPPIDLTPFLGGMRERCDVPHPNGLT
jgi:hypothetical protein